MLMEFPERMVSLQPILNASAKRNAEAPLDALSLAVSVHSINPNVLLPTETLELTF